MSGPQGSFEPAQRAPQPIDPHVRIGHVHLCATDIDRVRAFYVDLLRFVGRLLDAGVEPCQAIDHGTHLAVYVTDPDGNGVELAWDRPPPDWPSYESGDFITAPMEIDALLAHAPSGPTEP